LGVLIVDVFARKRRDARSGLEALVVQLVARAWSPDLPGSEEHGRRHGDQPKSL